MAREKYTIEQLAQWFINRGKLSADMIEDDTELISPLKLQKLLYYAQACSLALNGEKLFDEPMLKWEKGPVNSKIYKKYKVCGRDGIDDCEPVEIDEKTAVLLEFIYCKFGKFGAGTLSEMTHQDECWIKAGRNEAIADNEMKRCFEEKWLDEVDIDCRYEEYSAMAETSYINSVDDMADYLQKELKNPKDDLVEFDWKNM